MDAVVATDAPVNIGAPADLLDADIEACFDRIEHTALMARVRARVKDKRVLALVRAFLKAGIMTELGEYEDTYVLQVDL